MLEFFRARFLEAIAVFLFTLLVTGSALASQPVAFPGAEGFGAYTQGGRGGKVLFVTNLLDYQKRATPIPGSLRAAVEASGPRTVIFQVSGIIALKSELRISNPFLTIAGQSAPGDGICLTDYPLVVSSTREVILRHLRIRPGENQHEEIDALIIQNSENIIVDHCSTSWSTDEVFSPEGRNITVQWCIISEGLDRSFHPKGKHSKGSIIRSADGGITFHHNLYAHNADRNPKLESFPNQPGLLLDFRNNVIYDWGYQTGYSGRDYGRLNYVGNYLKPGPSSQRGVHFAFRPGGDRTKIFLADCQLEFGDTPITNPARLILWDGNSLDEVLVANPFPAPAVTTQAIPEATQLVLAQAGATRPLRDVVDERIVNNFTHHGGGIINSQDEVGGWPRYESLPAPVDNDGDGMPDDWESAHALNPHRSDNNGDVDGDGFTNLEEYLNGTDPGVPDHHGDHAAFLAVLRRVDEMNVRARPAIKETARKEQRAAAERQPPKIPVQIVPSPAAAAKEINVQLPKAPDMPMVLIPAGSFVMGSPVAEAYRKPDEIQHRVTITRPFYLGVYTVTRRQFAAVMQSSAPSGENGNLPQTIAWDEAVWFCRNLSHSTGRQFRLATEAEWEYACRAGTTTPFYTGETISTAQANFNGSRVYGPGTQGIYRDRLTPPGTFAPNAWGVCDMHGNFYEWCSDWRAPYPAGEQSDPEGPRQGRRRVIRGGNFSSHPAYLRSASRYDYDPRVDFAFRVVMETELRP